MSKQVAKRIWWGGEPYLDLVIDVGKKLGVNGVLLCHVQVLPGAHAIGCHAIDVSSKRSFKAKRTTTGVTSDAVQSAIEEALEKMLSAGSARTPGSKRKAQTETTSSLSCNRRTQTSCAADAEAVRKYHSGRPHL